VPCLSYKNKKKDQFGWTDTEYVESCQLPWAAQSDGCRPLDIPKGIEQYIDVVASRSNSAQLILQLVSPLLSYEQVMEKSGTYRLVVLVSGEGFEPEFHRIIVTHTGKWDEVTVDREPGISAEAWTG
jgi:hypothetical protein